ncbi:helix-turn-helix domain-containing protein [Thiomicrorhabdus sp. Milos-T2]|uniref:helix-turn-helix domain-containing protein n=1 Tax=Thiomicrorhabdus sp. Milos-T2 TaxID=90814 RepID=UPI0004945B85|nr:helix-turn-helix domain-containing protein [Thiomicrorhabdus sp. Milos-T2]
MRVNSLKELSVLIQNQRLKKDYSQNKVADLASMRQATVSSFEANPANAKLETLFKLLSALDLELEVSPKGQGNSVSELDW